MKWKPLRKSITDEGPIRPNWFGEGLVPSDVAREVRVRICVRMVMLAILGSMVA
jgi:hypothetical protein